MTSKEALQQLNNFIPREKHINSERNKIINECINIIKQDLERLETLELERANYSWELDVRNSLLNENEKLRKVIDWIKHTFEITLDSKVRISDGIDCIQAFPIDLKTNEVIYEPLKKVLDND